MKVTLNWKADFVHISYLTVLWLREDTPSFWRGCWRLPGRWSGWHAERFPGERRDSCEWKQKLINSNERVFGKKREEKRKEILFKCCIFFRNWSNWQITSIRQSCNTSSFPATAVQSTCMEVFHSERPLVQQSGIVVSVCQRGRRWSRFHRTLCSLPATETRESSSLNLNQLLIKNVPWYRSCLITSTQFAPTFPVRTSHLRWLKNWP